MNLYTYNGNKIYDNNNMSVKYSYDEVGETFYYLTKIFQTKLDGTKQYPFTRFPYSDAQLTPQQLRQTEGWNFIINAGWYVLQIENSRVIQCTDPQNTQMALTINNKGELGYLESWSSSDGQSLINRGIVSATSSFFPIIVNHEKYDYPTYEGMDTETWRYAQRQIIGQYENGDYAFITSEGRGYNNSKGLTIDRAQDLCLELGLKFAYNTDGGGSTQTILDKKRLTEIYEGTEGRAVHGFIVFNGTDEFFIPKP